MTIDGKIIKSIGGNYYVAADGKTILCRARGKLRRETLSPAVGDRVSVLMSGEEGSIREIYPRKNYFIRPNVANIDILAAVCAAASPAPDFALIDKLLVTAESKNVEAIVCINKIDLVNRAETEKIADIYKSAGYKVVLLCAGEGKGHEKLEALIAGKTAAFAGLSGVGKSSILSLVTGKELKTGDVSKIERGRHTTRCVELLEAFGGYVFDTPGFSRLDIEGIKPDELKLLFPELARLEGQCRFRGCTHTAEPDCAVSSALMRGEIAPSRVESYRAMYLTLKSINAWE